MDIPYEVPQFYEESTISSDLPLNVYEMVDINASSVEINAQFFDHLLTKLYCKNHSSSAIAPLSLAYVFGMILPALNEVQKQSVLSTVFETRDEQKVHDKLHSFLKQSTKLKFANLIASSQEQNSSYKQFLNNGYQAAIESLNDPAIVDKINRFVKQSTKGLILKLFDTRSDLPSTGAAIINAGYFDGQWDFPFYSSENEKSSFQTTNGAVEKEFMQRTLPTRFYEDDKASYVEIPLEQNKFTLKLVLPKTSSLGISIVGKEALHRYHEQALSEFVDVRLPKVKLETNEELLPLLSEFSHLFSQVENLGQISSIIQKTKLEIKEEGIVGAFATGGMFKTGYEKPHPTKHFHADKTFFFSLQNSDGDTILQGIIDR